MSRSYCNIKNKIKKARVNGIRGSINKIVKHVRTGGSSYDAKNNVRIRSQDMWDSLGRNILVAQKETVLSPSGKSLHYLYIITSLGRSQYWLELTIARLRQTAPCSDIYVITDKCETIFRESNIYSGMFNELDNFSRLNKYDYLIFVRAGDELVPFAHATIDCAINEQQIRPDIIYADTCSQFGTEQLYYKFILQFESSAYYGYHPAGVIILSNDFFQKNRVATENVDQFLSKILISPSANCLHISKILYISRVYGDEVWQPAVIQESINGIAKRSLTVVICNVNSKADADTVIRSFDQLSSIFDLKYIVVSNSAIYSTKHSNVTRFVSSSSSLIDKINMCMEHIHSEYVCVCSKPVILTEIAINQLFFKLMDTGFVSPKILAPEGVIQYAGSIAGSGVIFESVFQTFNNDSLPSYLDVNRRTSYISDICLFTSFDLLKKVMPEITSSRFFNIELSLLARSQGLHNSYYGNLTVNQISEDMGRYEGKGEFNTLLAKWGEQIFYEPYISNELKSLCLHVDSNSQSHYSYISKQTKKSVLVYSHELTTSGAPLVALSTVSVLQSADYFCTVVSPVDGQLRNNYIKMGVPVLIIPHAEILGRDFEKFALDFDLVLANTVVSENIIKILSGKKVPVFWWIHEGQLVFDIISYRLPPKLGPNIHVYSVSNYTKKYTDIFYGKYSTKVLPFGFEDYCKNSPPFSHDGKIRIVLISQLIEYRKGIDVFLKSLDYIPKGNLINIEITIIGKLMNDNLSKIFVTYCQKYGITHISSLNHEALMNQFDRFDIIIVPSRDEPMSIVAVEGMMFSKLIIVSSATGISGFIESGVNGFIFESEHPKQLSNILLEVINNYQKYDEMRAKAHLTYYSWFTPTAFKERLLKEVDYIYEHKSAMIVPSSSALNPKKIMIICPAKREYLTFTGDYIFSKSIAKYFSRRGFEVDIRCMEDWYNNFDGRYVLVLRGGIEYRINKKYFNMMWNISHPESISIKEYNQYDHIFVASAYWREYISRKIKKPSSILPQCTDPEVISNVLDNPKSFELLFIGYAHEEGRKAIIDLFPTKHDVAIYGPHWKGKVDEKYIKGEMVNNYELGQYYHDAKIVLNDHHKTMRDYGFLSNRLYDVFAAGSFVISDNVKNIGDLFESCPPVFTNHEDLSKLIDYYIDNEDARNNLIEKMKNEILSKHTFLNRVDEIINVINTEDKHWRRLQR